jgi:hypothetical protein
VPGSDARAQDSLEQARDSVRPTAEAPKAKDSVRPIPKKVTAIKKKDSATQILIDTIASAVPVSEQLNFDAWFRFRRALAANNYFNFIGEGIIVYAVPHPVRSHNTLFYALVAILFIFAFIKLWYGKYLANLFTLFFRVSMRQHQIREQVLQSPLPSLLLNGLFIISGGMYAAFLLRYFGFGRKTDFWLLFLNSAAVSNRYHYIYYFE